MAKIFLGDVSKVDPEVLHALEGLPDEFWVLGEITLKRNHDWLIIRPRTTAPSTLIVTEVKRQALPLRGSVNGVWEEKPIGEDWTVVPTSHADDKNYYWQAVNSANALSEWLRNNAPVFDDGDGRAWAESKVWPDLLVLSPPEVRHRLPLKPDSGFGMWYFDPGRWVEHLASWRPTIGPQLTEEQVERLVRHLGLTPHMATVSAEAAAELASVASASSQTETDLALTVRELEARVQRLELLVRSMARALQAAGGSALLEAERPHQNGGRTPVALTS